MRYCVTVYAEKRIREKTGINAPSAASSFQTDKYSSMRAEGCSCPDLSEAATLRARAPARKDFSTLFCTNFFPPPVPA